MSRRKSLTVASAKRILSAVGMTLAKNREWGEFTVRRAGTKGDIGVYHTDDLEDALRTGQFMARSVN